MRTNGISTLTFIVSSDRMDYDSLDNVDKFLECG